MQTGWDTGTPKMRTIWDTENADKMLELKDTKNADRLGHRDIKNVENKKMGEERRKVGIRSRRPLKLTVA